MTDARQIVILSAARTPIGTFGGAFAAVPPIELATIATPSRRESCTRCGNGLIVR